MNERVFPRAESALVRCCDFWFQSNRTDDINVPLVSEGEQRISRVFLIQRRGARTVAPQRRTRAEESSVFTAIRSLARLQKQPLVPD